MITLMTDFGYKDSFVGAMKGVIYGINPDVNVVDITHGVTRHSIAEAAMRLSEYFKYYPMKTIHIVVVDPGVGSGRRPIFVECDGHYFIGPDNGVFTKVIQSSEETMQIRHITAKHYFLPEKGNTFHGRDVFAPVAAWVSKGTRIDSLGEVIEDYKLLDMPAPVIDGGQVNGAVIYSDSFGNAITNITRAEIDKIRESKPDGSLRVILKGGQTDMKDYFEQGNDKRPHGLLNSSGYLEIFFYMSSATHLLKLKPGDEISVKLS